MMFLPLARPLMKSSTLLVVRLKQATVKPLLSMLRIRFSPITARPTTPISALLVFVLLSSSSSLPSSLVLASIHVIRSRSVAVYTPLNAENPPSTGITVPVTKPAASSDDQPQQRPDQVLRVAELAHRRLRDDRVAARRQRPVLLRQQRAVLVGQEEARGDGVDADADLRHVHGQPLREVADRRLGAAVGGDLGQRREGVHRRDVDDHAAAALGHAAREHLRRQQRAQEVQVEDELDAVGVEVVERDHAFGLLLEVLREEVLLGCRALGVVAAGAVDQDVDRTQRRLDLLRAASRLSRSSTLQATPMALPPAAMSRATASAASSRRSATATAAPHAASAFAMQPHRTPPPPVTRAVRPARSILSLLATVSAPPLPPENKRFSLPVPTFLSNSECMSRGRPARVCAFRKAQRTPYLLRSGRLDSVTWTNGSVYAAYAASYACLADSDLVAGYDIGVGTNMFRTRKSYEASRNLIATVSNLWSTTSVSVFDYGNDAIGRRTNRIDRYVVPPSGGPVTNRFTYNPRSELIDADMGTNAYGLDLSGSMQGAGTIGGVSLASLMVRWRSLRMTRPDRLRRSRHYRAAPAARSKFRMLPGWSCRRALMQQRAPPHARAARDLRVSAQ